MTISNAINSIPTDERSSNQLVKECLKLIYPVSTGHSLIRLGASADGRYLIPNCLEHITTCFSAGIDYQTNFENDLARIFGIPCYLCDPSHDRPPQLHPLNKFDKLTIAYDNQPNSKTLAEWCFEKSDFSKHHLLSMDIEGNEYQVFKKESYELLQKFTIITLELHSLHLLHHQFFSKNTFIPMIQKFLTLFDIVHVHPNNNTGYANMVDIGTLTDCLELTMLRKDYRKNKPVAAIIPHPLDAHNTTNKPPISFPDLDILLK